MSKGLCSCRHISLRSLANSCKSHAQDEMPGNSGESRRKSLKSKDFSVYPRTGRGSPWSSSPANLEEFVEYVSISMKCHKVICHRNRFFFFFFKGRKKSHRVALGVKTVPEDVLLYPRAKDKTKTDLFNKTWN